MRPSLFLLAAALCIACQPVRYEIETPVGAKTTLITNVAILDGSGEKATPGSVRIADAIIVGVGELSPRPGEPTIDGGGLVLAPGFIDTHSHADRGLRAGSDGLGALSQGITTVVVGQDGSSEFPIEKFFERFETGSPLNVASYVGHGTLRSRVMGRDYKREARVDEIQKISILLEEELRAGALGMSTGLEYDPGIYASKNEVLQLATRAGSYASHIRSEDRAFWDAIDEVVEIGRRTRAPVHISHMKLAMTSIWGKSSRLINTLNSARRRRIDISADVYPYRYWQSDLTVLFPERDFANRAAAEFALREVAQADSITLTSFGANPMYEGKTLAQIARMRESDPASTLMALIQESEAARASGRGSQTIIATSMTEADIEAILKWPFANICTDGELDGKHPRGFGAFTRVLGRYVRERHVITFPEAIRKMTSLAAANAGIQRRGWIDPGMFADLVLLDTNTVADRATPEDPHAISTGIAKVWVNGVLAYDNGHVTGARAGKVIRY
ncbi:MAG TPA: amidohydrolase family protein [Gemmatimonadaceae bacterium]